MRRCGDRLIPVLLPGALIPLLALVAKLARSAFALLFRLNSPGPALSISPMVGNGGRLIPLLRFRTMAVAEGQRGQLTRVGRAIRELSLGHHPGLLNGAWGDMAFVGPRPMKPERVDLRAPLWRQYGQLQTGFFNPAVLALGREWKASHASRPTLNQRLERASAASRSSREDWRLIRRTRRAWRAS